MLEARDKGIETDIKILPLNVSAAGAAARAREAALFPPPLALRHPNARPKKDRAKVPVGGATKRALDAMFSAAAIVVLAPMMAIIAVIVKLESPGPVLFAQRRGGYRGRVFLIYKFRSMTTCDDGRTIKQATAMDSRVTRFGAFLRRTSLDELPQLFNVFLGDMAMIGPRPHALAHDDAFSKMNSSYRLRFRARPGITGLAQVSGSRGPTASEEAVAKRVRFDKKYIEKWSLWLDFTIFVRTLILVLIGANAF